MFHSHRFITISVFTMLLSSLVAGQTSNAAPVQDDEEAHMRTIQVTRWDDPNTRPETYLEYRRAQARAGYALDAPFQAKLTFQSQAAIYAGGRRLDILMHGSLHEALKNHIDLYIRDVELEGWAVTLWLCEGGKPAEVRSFLQKRYAGDAIKGCLMIGELPVAWYEMDDDFKNKHSEFPTDLFYMDLDGAFGDEDNDGKFDSHSATTSGDQRPEIFVGRLKSRPLAGSWGTEESLLQNYFNKVHHYRTGRLTASERALSFVDDDWYTMNVYQSKAYSNVVNVTDKATTTAANYQKRLDESYESVVVCAHSSYASHSFKVPGSSGGRYTNTQLWSQDPPCLFYNLFACSNARYTSTRNMGAVYMFVDTSGLIAVGTTKTGSMLYFSDYYQKLGEQKHFGEAFRYWFEKRYPYSLGDRRWFYGMTLLGDPTLRISRPSLTARTTSLPSRGIRVDFEVDGRPDNAGQIYGVLGSLSGTMPGTPFEGVRLSINWDWTTYMLMWILNSEFFPNGMGNLDSNGKATAKFIWDQEIPKALLGKKLEFAALVLDSKDKKFVLSTQPAAVILGSTKP